MPVTPSPQPQAEPRVDLWVDVLVDWAMVANPGLEVLTYQVPEEMPVEPGDVVMVPLGAQQVGAIVLTLRQRLPPDLKPEQVRPLGEVVCSGLFPPGYWACLERVAQYYYTPLMAVVRTALPPGLLSRSQRRIALNPEAIPPEPALFLRPRALALLQLLRRSKGGDYSWRYVQSQLPQASQGLRDLLQRGWVRSYLEAPTPLRPKMQKAVTLVREPDPTEALTDRQRQVLMVLMRSGGDRGLQELLQQCHSSSQVVASLAKKGLVVVQDREILRTESGEVLERDQPKSLSADQAQALDRLHRLEGYHRILLHGVTGSGKTEVYLQAIAPRLQRGESALVLVPEIALTPQLTDRFRQRFGSQVCVYHSALSDGERYDTWRQMLQGTPQVVIGTRSAIFAPLPRLGLIILDEEHDSSFKQTAPQPCYHARTVAQWRAALAPCPLILGSATPALETWYPLALQGLPSENLHGENLPDTAHLKLTSGESPQPHPNYLPLPRRIYDRPFPPIHIVDMRQEFHCGNRSIFSRSLQKALGELGSGRQGLLFVPRRGHSTFVSCRSCGEALGCPHCDVSLSHHQPHPQGRSLLRCHYCNHTAPQPDICPHCGSPYLKFFGSGTQRVTQELSRHFPDLRWLRFDSDTTRTKGSHRALLTQFAQGEADVLVGTQMLTKGIDLPQITLVGVMAADGLFHLPDFRAAEQACQTLIQVAGRSGRGDDPGRVIVQTYKPEHPVIMAIQQQSGGHGEGSGSLHPGYGEFLQGELEQRSPLHYPPYGQLILLRLSGLDPSQTEVTAEKLGDLLRSRLPDSIHLLGPAPAPIVRVARRYRWHLLLKLLNPEPTTPSPWPDLPLEELRQLCPKGIALTLDVDPMSLS